MEGNLIKGTLRQTCIMSSAGPKGDSYIKQDLCVMRTPFGPALGIIQHINFAWSVHLTCFSL